jgi:arginase family enzyme
LRGLRAFKRCSTCGRSSGFRSSGYDVVEVAPQYDGPGQITALFAANAIFEMLSMVARHPR